MGTSIAETITDRIDDMPAGERRAAQALIANYPMLGLKTVAEFAARAGVSSPTILRFVSRIGFPHYAEFQSALNDELAAQLQSPLSRTGGRANRPGEPTPLLATTLENITETFRHLSDRQTDDIVTVLADKRRKVLLVGGRFTDPLARYMAAHLAIIRPGVSHLAGQESSWRDRLLDIGKRDVLVVFDIRRYQDSLFSFADKARRRGASVVLITDQWLSPIVSVADHVVAGRTAVPSAWDSSAALFVVVERLIAGVTDLHAEDSATRIREMDALRQA